MFVHSLCCATRRGLFMCASTPNIGKPTSIEATLETGNSIYEFGCTYPEENDKNALDIVTAGLAHVGVLTK